MKTILSGLLVSLCLVAAGCDYTGTPVAFSKTCDKANDDTTVEVVGYFKNKGSAMCSKSGNSPMRCPFDFLETPESTEGMVSTEIDLGSGGSSVEDVEGKGLTIHDKDGAVVEDSQRVKMTANVYVLDTPRDSKKFQDCYVTVKKIEKTK